MTKERIVLETSNQRKAALVSNLALQGDTITDWLEEQISLSVPKVEQTLPRGASFIDGNVLSDPDKVFEFLSAKDWAFTDDNTRYLTHDLHPYPAKFIPQIPAHLIAALSLPGDVIFDPFGGSATTAVEAVRLGRRAVSMDANPLSQIIGRVKTGYINIATKTELEQLQSTVLSYINSEEFSDGKWSKTTRKKYAKYIPEIPNVERWFHEHSISELALLCHLIENTTTGLAKDAAKLALSRIILRVSFQESETRYVSEPRLVEPGAALNGFVESLRTVTRRLANAAPELQAADARFLVGDSRVNVEDTLGDGSVNLIVTSPPYPNATDYHLYHRFRLFWLGFDPRAMGAIEIGSHLRHQRNDTGFEEYRADMEAVLRGCYTALQPGRYAVFVVGDAVFKGVEFSTSDATADAARKAGFELVGVIDRPIHETRRSFSRGARRARDEQLVILRKPDKSVKITLTPPAYKMWEYEKILRKREIEGLLGTSIGKIDPSKNLIVETDSIRASALRRLTFTRELIVDGKHPVPQPTWQKVLENGDSDSPKRKDPKYATHGIHPYKGKFYPQLAKSLINISGVSQNGVILDPFCGSGTVLLESMLNGFAAFGSDMNPLAAKIARAKTEIFSVDQATAYQALHALLERMKCPPTKIEDACDQFSDDVLNELEAWFPKPVIKKLNWILTQIRLFGDKRLVEFGEVILSSIIREISQQDPTDLRIRRRKEPLTDAPAIELFADRLGMQLQKLEKYWSICGRQPGPTIKPKVIDGDCRDLTTFLTAGLNNESVDCVVTSPPYATALPYIDTDRLSIMTIMGMDSGVRSYLEENLTGSREIKKKQKASFEAQLLDKGASKLLPEALVSFLRGILIGNQQSEAGFRRQNMASLLWRYFIDMKHNIQTIHKLLKPGGVAYYVVGNSRTNVNGDWIEIDTCGHLISIADMLGFEARSMIDISVTTDNHKHIKNAITENAVLEFRKRS